MTGAGDGATPWIDEEPAPPPWPDEEREPGAPQAPADLFRRWTLSDLLAADTSFRWLVRGVSVDPSYGQIAGEMKTLKTYVSTLLTVSVATGKPLFDQFTVDRPGPVLVYVGEGGRVPYTRRLRRVVEAIGGDGSTPIITSYDVAPVTSSRFQESLARDLAEVEPVMVIIDPLYAFHGAHTDSRNLHEEGGLLTSISAPVVAAGASCWIVNHFNQTGTGAGLKRITQAGSGEWADSWILLAHREPADVAAGNFRLSLDIGSRQWGGTSWDLDLGIGHFDPDLGTHDGPITWDLHRAGTRPAADSGDTRVLEAVDNRPGELIREDLAKAVGGNLVDARSLVDQLERRGLIRRELVDGKGKDGRNVRSWRYFPQTWDQTALDLTSTNERETTENA